MPGDDYAALVRDAVSRGADALAMAGGDGSQAIVAAIASEHSLPYACVPAGTRNHFALDLGVDRDDVVGALDAFVDGAERVVDLADVNGRIFVNNVSLGIYGEAVQRPGYRNAKLRTLLETIPQAVGPRRHRRRAALDRPRRRAEAGPRRRCWSPTTPTVSSSVSASPGRPRLDEGLLGILVLGEPEAGARRSLGAPPRGANGPLRRSRSRPGRRSQRASTARPRRLEPPLQLPDEAAAR